jgi:hypothetical protein
MNEIKFGTLPTNAAGGGRGPHEHDSIATQLRSKPNEWAQISEDAHTSMAGQIRKGKIPAYRPAGSFEARYVLTDRDLRRGEIRARYVGDEEPTTATERRRSRKPEPVEEESEELIDEI